MSGNVCGEREEEEEKKKEEEEEKYVEMSIIRFGRAGVIDQWG